jgi:hypothetical protein
LPGAIEHGAGRDDAFGRRAREEQRAVGYMDSGGNARLAPGCEASGRGDDAGRKPGVGSFWSNRGCRLERAVAPLVAPADP